LLPIDGVTHRFALVLCAERPRWSVGGARHAARHSSRVRRFPSSAIAARRPVSVSGGDAGTRVGCGVMATTAPIRLRRNRPGRVVMAITRASTGRTIPTTLIAIGLSSGDATAGGGRHVCKVCQQLWQRRPFGRDRDVRVISGSVRLGAAPPAACPARLFSPGSRVESINSCVKRL
jgi:hypothetical protein